jgi:hypothetical protein
MRSLTAIVIGLSALGAASRIPAQITTNPLPAPIERRGLTVEIRDVVRLPETRGLRPADQDVNPAGWARVSFVRDLPDGRRFVNDPVSARPQQQARGLCRCRGRVSVRDL